MNPPLENFTGSGAGASNADHSLPAGDSDPFSDLVGAGADHASAAPRGSVVPFAPADDFVGFYGLRENPFADCVHPAFFFRTESHGAALRDMMLAVEFRTSLGLVTGPSGSGKTLVSQLLLKHFEEQNQPVVLVLVTPGLSKTGLLREILSELNLALPVGVLRVQDLMRILGDYIIELHQGGQRLVILVDECHLLSADCLHVVRTISNIETPDCKLTTCLLFGESRLAQRLEHPSFESLRNRIYLRSTLGHLTSDEAEQYVKFRLMTVDRLDDLFTDAAVLALHEQSGGICRSLNKIGMLSMIEGAERKCGQIGEDVVRAAALRM